MSLIHVGLIGLGAMGSGIAQCLSRANIILSVYDKNKRQLELNSQSSNVNEALPEEIIADCDVILFCVPSSKQINELLEKCEDDDTPVESSLSFY